MARSENENDRLNGEGTVYYILSPYRSLLSRGIKITLIVFAAYILSANTLLFCIMVPIYVLCGHIYYKLWLLCKKHAVRLLPFLLSILVLNIPFWVASFFVRQAANAMIAYF
ncbi:MAG: hypothetical protein IJY89_00310 [Clostridia bacterium]|nr:hypothetical protein [Clostridia bacterium]